jgi:hypothetical protein
MFKILRIAILLLILLGVALGAWREKMRSVEWKYALPVNIYPVSGDGSPAAADYMRGLTVEDFKPIEAFMRDEAVRYGRSTKASIEIRLRGKIDAQPPAPPRNGNALQVIMWSLKMRWWAYRHTDTAGPRTQVNMFVLYFDPASNARLDHSTGLQKGLIGRVNAFASRGMAQQNNVVIAHEFLHTLGATDKYDPVNNQPIYPDGYAAPDRVPLLPQKFAEIMAGRTPLSQTKAETPTSLELTLIGSKTAREINWL